MSKNIDDRIVQMEFNNKQFERNIEQSSKSLEKFNEQLEFKGAKKGVRDLESAVGSVNFSHLSGAVDSLENHFTNAFERLKTRVVDKFLDDMASKVKDFVKRMTITPISSGWKKYEENTQSVQTIMAATGKTIEEVQASMSKLMWFTDETSYNFVDMTGNIGKFTSAGVDLDVAVTAMEGIATWAALSGRNAAEASRAMYNLSQAIGMGAVTAIDWKSIQNVNMDTIEFKKRVIEAAKALGKLNKQGKTAKGTLVTAENFYSTLSQKWFTSDVLLKVLGEFGEFADTMYEETKHGLIPASEAMAKYSSEVKTIGERAFRAAQEAKTLTDALGSVDDATSTSWMKTWELIFGNYEEAKVLFTDLANALWEIFNAGNAIRNEALSIWHDLDKNENGRIDALQAVYDILGSIGFAAEKAREAIEEIIPTDVDSRLGFFKSATKSLTEAADSVRELLGYEEEVVQSGRGEVIESFDDALKRGSRGEGVKDMQRRLEELGYSVGKAGIDGIFGPDTEAALKKFQQESKFLDKKKMILGLYDAQTQVALISAGMSGTVEETHTATKTMERMGTQTEKIQKIAAGIASTFRLIGKVLNFGWSVVKLIAKTLAPIGNGLLVIITAIADCFTSLNNTLDGDNIFAKWLDDIETRLEPVRSKIEEITNSVLEFLGLAPKLDENGEAISSDTEELMTFSKLWNNIRTSLEESGALDRLSEAFENLKASIETIKETIKGWWKTLTESLSEDASEKLTGLWDKFPGIAETVVNALTSVINWLSEKASKIPDAIDSIVGWFTDLYTTLRESETIKNVGARLREAFAGIKKAFESIAPSASKWLDDLRILIFGGGEDDKKGFTGKLKDALPGVIEKIGNGLSSALEFFAKVIENIPSNVDKIKKFFTDLYNDLKESEKVQKIVGVVEGIVKSIGGVLASIWEAIANFLTGGGSSETAEEKRTRQASRKRKKMPIADEVEGVETVLETVSDTTVKIELTADTISETIDGISSTVDAVFGVANSISETVGGIIGVFKGSSESASTAAGSIYGIVSGLLPQTEGVEGTAADAYKLIDDMLGISSDASSAAEGISEAIETITSVFLGVEETVDSTLGETKIDETLSAFNGEMSDTKDTSEDSVETLGDTRTFLEKVGDGFKAIMSAVAPWAIGAGFVTMFLQSLRTAVKVPQGINSMLQSIALIKYGPSALQGESKTQKFLKIAGGIALLAGAVFLIANGISMIGKMSAEELKRGGIAMGIIMTVLIGFSAAIGALSNKVEFGSLSSVTTGVGGAIIAILGIVAAIWLISKMSDHDLIKGGVVLGAIFVFLGILFVGISRLNKGNGINANMNGIWGLAAVILALVAAMWLIGHMKITTIIKGAAGLVVLAVTMRIFMASLSKAGDSMANAKWGWIIAVSILILVLAGTMKKLGNMKTENLIKGIIGLEVVMISAAKMLKSISESSKAGSGAIKGCLGLVLVVAVIAAAIIAIGSMKTEKIIAAGGVLTAVLLMAALIVKNVGRLKVKKGNWAGVVSMLGSLVLIAGLMGAFYLVVKGLEGTPLATITVVGNAIKGILMMSAIMMSVVNKTSTGGISPLKNAANVFLTLTAVFAAILLAVGAMMLLTKIPGFNSSLARVGQSIGAFVGNIAGAFLAAKMKSFASGLNTYAEEMNGVEDPGDDLLTKTLWALDIAEAIRTFEDRLDGIEGAASIGGSAAAILNGWAAIVFYESIGSFGTNFGLFVDAMNKVDDKNFTDEEKADMQKKIDYAIAVALQIHDFNSKITSVGGENAVGISGAIANVLNNWTTAAAWSNIASFGTHFNDFVAGMSLVKTEDLGTDFETKVERAVQIASYVQAFEQGLQVEGIEGAIGAYLGQLSFGKFTKNLGNFGTQFHIFAMQMRLVPAEEIPDLDTKTKNAVAIAQSILALGKSLTDGDLNIEKALAAKIQQGAFGKFIKNLGNFGTNFAKYAREMATLGEEVTGENGETLAEAVDLDKLKETSDVAVAIASSIAELSKALGDSTDFVQAWGHEIDQKTFAKFIENIPNFAESIKAYFTSLNSGLWDDTEMEQAILQYKGVDALEGAKTKFEQNHQLVLSIIDSFQNLLGKLARTYAGLNLTRDHVKEIRLTFEDIVDFLGNKGQREGLAAYAEAVRDFHGTADVVDQTNYFATAIGSIASLIKAASDIEIKKSTSAGSLRVIGTKEKLDVVLTLIKDFADALKSKKDILSSLGNNSDMSSGLILAVNQIIKLINTISGITGFSDIGTQAFVSGLNSTINLIATLGESINQFYTSTLGMKSDDMNEVVEAIDAVYGTISTHVLATSQQIVTDIKAANSEAIATLGELFGLNEGSEVATTATGAGEAIGKKFIDAMLLGMTCEESKNKVSSGDSSAIAILAKLAKYNAYAYMGYFYNTGKDFTRGLAKGILESSAVSQAISAARQVASQVVGAVKEELDEHSPSKVAEQIGTYFDVGLANGLTNSSGIVTIAAKGVSEDAVKASNNIFSAVVDALSEGIDYEPVIRPVLDLSNVRAGANTMNNLIGTKSFNLASTEIANRVATTGAVTRQSNLAEDLRSVNDRLDNLGDAMTHLKVVMDSGVVAGEISPYVDKNLGKVIQRRGRG